MKKNIIVKMFTYISIFFLFGFLYSGNVKAVTQYSDANALCASAGTNTVAPSDSRRANLINSELSKLKNYYNQCLHDHDGQSSVYTRYYVIGANGLKSSQECNKAKECLSNVPWTYVSLTSPGNCNSALEASYKHLANNYCDNKVVDDKATFCKDCMFDYSKKTISSCTDEACRSCFTDLTKMSVCSAYYDETHTDSGDDETEDIKHGDKDEGDRQSDDDMSHKPQIIIGNLSCESLGSLLTFIRKVYRIGVIFMVIGLVIFTAIDYTKAVINSDQDAMKKANKRAVIRVLITIIMILLPTLIDMLLTLILPNYKSCMESLK